MGAELGDERSFKRAMREVAGEVGREQINEAVREAVEIANRILLEAGDSPPPEASLDEWSMGAIADSVETRWVKGESEGELAKGNALVAEWTHPHADKIEVGVRPHMIEGNPILVFEWPNAPDAVRAQFADAWESDDSFLEEPEVAFTEVDHPGLPALGYIRTGFRRSIRRNFD
jgi:hypothetical protein